MVCGMIIFLIFFGNVLFDLLYFYSKVFGIIVGGKGIFLGILVIFFFLVLFCYLDDYVYILFFQVIVILFRKEERMDFVRLCVYRQYYFLNDRGLEELFGSKGFVILSDFLGFLGDLVFEEDSIEKDKEEVVIFREFFEIIIVEVEFVVF